MDEKIIELAYNRKDFEDVYYRNREDRLLFNRHTKKEQNTSMVIGAITIILFLYNMIYSQYFELLIASGILFCLSLLDLYKKLSPLIKWRKEIKIYLDGLDKIRHNKIILTKSAFTLIQDKKETIEKWSEFRKAELEDNFVSLISTTTNYLIPAKSMTPDEFQFLKSMLSEQIKNES